MRVSGSLSSLAACTRTVTCDQRHSLGFHPYGYTSFHYDLTPYCVVARVPTVPRRTSWPCAWTTRSSPTRAVLRLGHLSSCVAHLHRPAARRPLGTYVRTPLVSKDVARVEVLTRVQNQGECAADCTLVTTVLDDKGAVVGTATSRHPIAPNQTHEYIQRLQVDSRGCGRSTIPISIAYTVRSATGGDRRCGRYALGTARSALTPTEGSPQRPACQDQRGLPAPRRRLRGAAVPERVWEAGWRCSRRWAAWHPLQPLSARARVPGPVRPYGLPGDDENFDEWRSQVCVWLSRCF